MRNELPSHTVSPADPSARNRPVEYVGVLLGSAAAALVFGAGVAHAEGDGSAASKPSGSSSSGQQSGSSSGAKTNSESGAPKSSVGAGPQKSNDTKSNDTKSNDTKSNDTKGSDTKSTSGTDRDAKDTTKDDGGTTKDVVTQPKTDSKNSTPPASQPTVGKQVVDTTATGARTLSIVKTPTPSDLASPTSLPATSPSAVPSATLQTTSTTIAPLAAVPAAPAAPTTTVVAGPPVPDLPAIARQLQGLTNDVAALGASLTYNTAIQVANAFGPNFLFGGPYYTALTVANFAGTISKQLTGTPLTATSTGPFPVNYGIFDTNAFLNPNVVPAGANDPNIKVTDAHPLPVILINGTLESQGYNWSVGAPVLANAGYKVYTFNYGFQPGLPVNGLGDIKASAQELSDEIDAVLKETEAKQVILVGHSQGGGILPEYYLNVMGGAPKVSQLIGISPSNHGTDLNFIAYGLGIPVIGQLIRNGLGATFPALEQQSINSGLIKEVYGNGDTQPGVSYTTIVSKYDGVVTPYTQQFLTGPDVTNILVQDQYPNLQVGHLGMFVNPATWSYVLDALSANPAANVNPLTAPLAVAV